MDTPSAGRWLSDALAAVRAGHDVIGMTHDGGYWGIGLAAPTGTEFAGVPMSTGHTGRAQAERLAALGRTVVELPAVHDIDHHGDIARVVADLPDSELARVAAGL